MGTMSLLLLPDHQGITSLGPCSPMCPEFLGLRPLKSEASPFMLPPAPGLGETAECLVPAPRSSSGWRIKKEIRNHTCDPREDCPVLTASQQARGLGSQGGFSEVTCDEEEEASSASVLEAAFQGGGWSQGLIGQGM